MIVKTSFTKKSSRAIRTQNLRYKKTLRDHLAEES